MSTKKGLSAVLFLFFISFLFFSKLFIPTLSFFFTPDLGRSDIFHHFYSTRFILSEALKSGDLPLWTSSVGTGIPLTSVGQIALFNVVIFLLFKSLQTPLAFNLSYVIFIFISLLGMFVLGRFLKFSYFTSIFISFVFSFSGFFIFHLTHTIYLSAAYLPFIFLFCLRIIKEKKTKDVLIFSFLLSQQIFAGHPQVVFITLIGIFIIALFWLSQIKNLSFLCLAILLGFFLSSIHIFPVLEFKDVSMRSKGMDYDEVVQDSLHPKHLLTFIYPFIFGSPKDASYKLVENTGFDIFWEKMGYLGILPIIFSFIGIFFVKTNSIFKKAAIWILFLSLFLALGKFSPLSFLYYFPPFNFFRVPARFILLTVLSISVLSGYGLDYLFEKFKEKKLSLIDFFFIKSILLLSIFIPSFLITYNYHPVILSDEVLKEPDSAIFLKDKPGRIYQLGAGLPYLEMLLSKGWQDISYYLFAKNSLDANMNLLYHKDQVLVYESALTQRQEAIQSFLRNEVMADFDSYLATPSALFKNILNLESSQYLISPFKILDKDLLLLKVITSSNPNHRPFYIYENLKVLPRARMVSNFENANSFEDALSKIKSKDFNPEQTAVLEKFSGKFFVENNDWKAEVIKDKDLEMDLLTRTKEEAVLVLSDSFYPGWKAYIDSYQTEIFPANINQRAIIIPKGEHKIKFLYQPDSLKKGAIISFFAVIIWLIFVVREVIYFDK